MNPENVVNSQKLTEMANDAKQNENQTGFMNPGEKQKKKGGRPTKEEAARKAAAQKASALGADPKKAQGGPTVGPKTEIPPEFQALSQIPSKEIAKPIVHLISSAAVQYVGDPRAAMRPEEFEAAAMSLGMIVDKYMPTVMTKYGAEAICLLTFGSYGLRIMAMKKVLAWDRAQAQNVGPQNAERMKPDENVKKVPEIFPQGEPETFQ